MSPLDALTALTILAVAPGLVWWLGRTGWSGDRKRMTVLAVAVALGVMQAVLTEVILLPPGWAEALGRALVTLAGTLTLTQAVYQLLWSKLPDTGAKRAEPV